MCSSDYAKELKLGLLLKRISSTVVADVFMLLYFWCLAEIIGNNKVFADFCIYFSTSYACATLLLFGQGRLLFMVVPDCPGKEAVTKAYIHFLACIIFVFLAIFCMGLLSVSMIDELGKHPIWMGVVLSPYLNVVRIGTNLLKVFEKPFLSQGFRISLLSVFLILSMLIIDRPEAGVRQFALLLSCISVVVGVIVLLVCVRHFDRFLSSEGGVLSQCFSIDQWTFSAEVNWYRDWAKKGVALLLDRIGVVVEGFSAPLLTMFHVSSVDIIAFTIVMYLIRAQYSLLTVLKNHLFPIIVRLLPEDGRCVSLAKQKIYQRICTFQWLAMGLMTGVIIAISPWVLASYGSEFQAYYPLLIIAALLNFPFMGCVLINVVMLKVKQLHTLFKKIQSIRIVMVLVLMLVLTYYMGVYGMVLALTVPGFLFMLTCVILVKHRVGLNLVWPMSRVID